MGNKVKKQLKQTKELLAKLRNEYPARPRNLNEFNVDGAMLFSFISKCTKHRWKKVCRARHFAEITLKPQLGDSVEYRANSTGVSRKYRYRHLWNQSEQHQNLVKTRLQSCCDKCSYKCK